MTGYSLTASDAVIRNEDGAFIPNDPRNQDWIEYQEWLADGGVPDPYMPPSPVPPTPSPEDEVLFDHENRLRAIEGLPPLTHEEFIALAPGIGTLWCASTGS
jgi:hypothetical protein